MGFYSSSMSFHGLIAHFFLVLDNIAFFRCARLFTHSSTQGHFGHFPDLMVIKEITINILYVWVFMWAYAFNSCRYTLRNVSARSQGKRRVLPEIATCFPKCLDHFCLLIAHELEFSVITCPCQHLMSSVM